jgi:DNA repair protein SbcC/Rad50
MHVLFAQANEKEMFNKLFKRGAQPGDATPAAVPAKEASAAAKAVDKEAWSAKLQASLGDDAALLVLAREAPLVDIKQAAVSALVGEEALKQAEREFRTQNQRVHRVAKQLYQAAVTQRESRAQASRLIESAAILLHETMVPANRLVELDQAWQTLDATLLTEEQKATYARLAGQLSAQLRERGEQRLAAQRWAAQSKEALQHLRTVCAEVESGARQPSELAPAVAALQEVWGGKPTALTGVEDAASLEEKVQMALAHAAELPARLATLTAARQSAPPPEAAKARTDIPPKPAKAKKAAAPPELAGWIEAAESALAAGHLAETRTQLVTIEHAVGEGKGMVDAPLRARLDAVQAEYARLKGWQHWGGGRVREDLVEEAEALARLVAPTEAVADEGAGEGPDEASGEGTGGKDGKSGGKGATKLNLKQHAQAIEQLRERWKELDHLGGAGGKALWPRFDAALKAAYVPVGELQGKLKAARQENLKARQQLMAELDALPLPAADAAPSDWREVARAIEQFDSEWRKLGPAEHTVPHKARDALLERRAASVARLETPLREARRAAQIQRQKLIERAKGLAGETRQRDAVAKVRELQAEWQQHAKALPLSRTVENAMWAEFKAATDAIFKQRDAEVSAREADFKAHQAARLALIARLGELSAAAPPGEVERSVAAIDREWRAAGEVARSEAPRLEEKFRAARAAALQLVAEHKQRAWHAVWDTLLAKLTLSEAAEAGGEPGGESGVESGVESFSAELETRWTAQAPVAAQAVPALYEQALTARFRRGIARLTGASMPEAPAAPDLDHLLLQLEAALDLPSPPEFQAVRRDLKLRAMKEAMEGRRSAPAADVEHLLASALAAPSHPAQAQRLRAIIGALRQRPAG